MLNTYFTNRSTHSNIFFPEMARSFLYVQFCRNLYALKMGTIRKKKKMPEIAYTKINVAGKRKLPSRPMTAMLSAIRPTSSLSDPSAVNARLFIELTSLERAVIHI